MGGARQPPPGPDSRAEQDQEVPGGNPEAYGVCIIWTIGQKYEPPDQKLVL